MMEMCELERKMVTDEKENCLSGLIIVIYCYCHQTKGYNYILKMAARKIQLIVCLHSEEQTSSLRTDFLSPTIITDTILLGS